MNSEEIVLTIGIIIMIIIIMVLSYLISTSLYKYKSESKKIIFKNPLRTTLENEQINNTSNYQDIEVVNNINYNDRYYQNIDFNENDNYLEIENTSNT